MPANLASKVGERWCEARVRPSPVQAQRLGEPELRLLRRHQQPDRLREERRRLAMGESAVNYKTRTAHSEALIVRGTVYDVDHLDQLRAPST